MIPQGLLFSFTISPFAPRPPHKQLDHNVMNSNTINSNTGHASIALTSQSGMHILVKKESKGKQSTGRMVASVEPAQRVNQRVKRVPYSDPAVALKQRVVLFSLPFVAYAVGDLFGTRLTKFAITLLACLPLIFMLVSVVNQNEKPLLSVDVKALPVNDDAKTPSAKTPSAKTPSAKTPSTKSQTKRLPQVKERGPSRRREATPSSSRATQLGTPPPPVTKSPAPPPRALAPAEPEAAEKKVDEKVELVELEAKAKSKLDSQQRKWLEMADQGMNKLIEIVEGKQPDWTVKKSSKTIKVTGGPLKGLKYTAFKSHGIVNCSAEKLFYLLYHAPTNEAWNADFNQFKSKLRLTPHADVTYTKTEKIGPISPRDLVQLRKWKRYRGGFVCAQISIEWAKIPATSAAVRAHSPAGSGYAIFPVAKNKCKCYNMMLSDIKGWLPRSLVNLTVAGALFKFYDVGLPGAIRSHGNRKTEDDVAGYIRRVERGDYEMA